ncbi:MAG TPA: TonB-dependent receptor [Phnomibacter sp.]|nr:TonB-dependent receptor [Phnomibacter sp.]
MTRRWKVFLLATLMVPNILMAQTDTIGRSATQDTLQVTITAFGQYRPESQSLPSLHILRGATLDRFNKTSFVQSLNTLPGVRMEERSPGSYRLNMRGSSLRSPFGVRNAKVYYNGLPLTDAGGNTYLNQLAFYNIASVEIAKGPGGSMYGAGTGGVVLLNTLRPRRQGMEAEITAGSFGLLQGMAQAGWSAGAKAHHAGIGFTQQDGYRHHTNMRRINASYSGEWIRKEKFAMQAHLLAADLYYRTPGGLTRTEFENDPKQARPRVGAQPSAKEAKAAIYQQNVMAGLTGAWNMDRHWKNETGIYGGHAHVRNPAIRNYETRSEPGWGGRSVFSNATKKEHYTQQWLMGGEAQWGAFHTQVFTNVNGERGSEVTNDELDFFTWNAFAQWQRQYGERWDLSAGLSYFRNRAGIYRKFPAGNSPEKKDYINDWAPRFSAIYRPGANWQVSALVSRGFSPPTVSELLPSTGVISTSLRPEYGWNYEAGIRAQLANRKIVAGINAFRFALQDALVQRRDSTGADFYTNAGGTRQQGIESFVEYLLMRPSTAVLQVVQVKAAYTFSHFRYTNYRQLSSDFSGKSLPSVPAHTLSLTADAQWKNSFFIRSTLYAASAIWLNDANTSKADPYQLLGVKAGYGRRLQIFAGVDNLLDQTYSLGNDINAFGGRYFNAAPARNYYGGLRVQI